ncbi:hypothetical protein J4212_03760 [Candidatus Woesearchaeota archaeon]|nr:hypothetical protein [Candidatus Woesearchaeota archaeon]
MVNMDAPNSSSFRDSAWMAKRAERNLANFVSDVVAGFFKGTASAHAPRVTWRYSEPMRIGTPMHVHDLVKNYAAGFTHAAEWLIYAYLGANGGTEWAIPAMSTVLIEGMQTYIDHRIESALKHSPQDLRCL